MLRLLFNTAHIHWHHEVNFHFKLFLFIYLPKINFCYHKVSITVNFLGCSHGRYYLQYNCNEMKRQWWCNWYNTIQASHTGGDPLTQYALLQYEHTIRQRGHICYLVDEKEINKGGNKKEVLHQISEVSSFVVAMEIEQDKKDLGHFTGWQRKVWN